MVVFAMVVGVVVGVRLVVAVGHVGDGEVGVMMAG